MDEHRVVGRRRVPALVLALGFIGLMIGDAHGQTGRGPTVRWIGQDGKDFVGPHNRLEPSDVQDVHIAITGLDPRREVKLVDVLAVGGTHSHWQYNLDSFAWKAVLLREKGSTAAELYIEPSSYVQARKYEVTIRYDDGREHKQTIQGRKVDPSLRTSVATLTVAWCGQDGRDVVGAGASVGPDGLEDVRLRLTGVSTKATIRAIRIDGPDGAKWESHINPELLPACEFRPDAEKPGEGDLFFQPTQDLAGKSLSVRLLYANVTGDRATVVARTVAPARRMPDLPAVNVPVVEAQVKWLGQDGVDVTGPGDVHVVLSGVDVPTDLVAATLVDTVRGSWLYQAADFDRLGATPEWNGSRKLAVRTSSTRGDVELFFLPYRDESDAVFTLRLIGKDGRSTFASFPGGVCDPDLRLPPPAPNRREARPGDDLQALVDQGGTIALKPGVYRLSKPLVLNAPVVLTADAGVTLSFSQPENAEPWTAAIKIHKGRTTLQGFAIRFEGPIRWNHEVSYGPTVIGTSDNFDPNPYDWKSGIVISRLDVEGPPSNDPSRWTHTVKMMRFTHADGGRVEGCRLLGGTIEFFHGPWSILGNTFRGAPAMTMAHEAIGGHYVNDVVVRDNRIKPEAPGKVWRFLIMTNQGRNVVVENNTVEGIGEIDGDGVPRVNAPEIMLTESYRIGYEGAVRGLSPDGRTLRIGERQGEPIRAGWFVAILSGPAAGTFRRVLTPINGTTVLLDAPIPLETKFVSIVDGFSGVRFTGNSVDIRGSSTSYGLVLPGNQFGTIVEGNRFFGGAQGMTASACASEAPVHWGWSRCPAMEFSARGNVFEDVLQSLRVSVSHDPKHIKFQSGRVYMSADLQDNVVRWTEPFLKSAAASRTQDDDPARPLLGIVLGEPRSRDPNELKVNAEANTLDAPVGRRHAPSQTVRAAEVNGRSTSDQSMELPRTDERTSTGARR